MFSVGVGQSVASGNLAINGRNQLLEIGYWTGVGKSAATEGAADVGGVFAAAKAMFLRSV